MDEEELPRSASADALREDLGREYEGIMKVVSEFDGRLMIVKGWSVPAASALGFWFIDALMKRHQMRYYSRMRDIEVAGFHLNHLVLNGQVVSTPKVDWWWGFTGQGGEFKSDVPVRRDPENVRTMLSRAPWLANVFLPHAVAVALGLTLFILAIAKAPGFDQLQL
ncbi:MAG: hypothetical protein JWR71_34 [Pseudarthrobacter sp.]|nr:hypothetical protein [Pseudarthrobacter sp.]